LFRSPSARGDRASHPGGLPPTRPPFRPLSRRRDWFALAAVRCGFQNHSQFTRRWRHGSARDSSGFGPSLYQGPGALCGGSRVNPDRIYLGMALAVFIAFLPVDARAQAAGAQAADSLPAFKSDSAAADPFQKVEAGPSLWSSAPSTPPATPRDSLAAGDSAIMKLRVRYPAVAVYLGVDFMDLDAKEYFNTALNARASDQGLRILQPYEAVHLAFPLGIQALLPVSGYLDVVIKTHSYWYQQKAILGDSASRHAGDATFAAQANLGGLGMRFYVPPPLLSVTGGLGLFAQGVVYWNLGRSELYSNRGS